MMTMSTTIPPYEPPPIEDAKRQYVELFGSALVMNTYLKIALLVVSLVAAGLVGLNFHTVSKYAHVKPLVIRIDAVGRAEAVQYDATTYQPQAPEIRYFLTQFVVKHFSRIRATVQREYPDSLLFLEQSLADATIAQNEQGRAIETFLASRSVDEIDVGKLAIGLPARLRVGALPDATITGKLTRIAPQATEKDNAKLFEVEIELDPGQEVVLRAGESATAE